MTSETTRVEYGISESNLRPTCPPGTKHLRGLAFTKRNWQELRDAGERVWLLNPRSQETLDGREDPGLDRYLEKGEEEEVQLAYKCTKRPLWYQPPIVAAPDLFFTYMSHRYPRLVANTARVTFLNSMHGVRLVGNVPPESRQALPLLMLNSATMLGAEVHGRAYGGGVLKMEPREAAVLPLPRPEVLEAAWKILKPERNRLAGALEQGLWEGVSKRVDEVLLHEVCGVDRGEVAALHIAGRDLRRSRMGRAESARQ
jgi:hypothetical protein